MRRRRLPLWLAIVLVVAPAALAWADIYQWTDRDGVIHFTNIKPRGTKAGRWRKVITSEPDKGSKAAATRGTCERCDKVPAADRTPERLTRYDAYITEAAELYKIPPALIRAIIKC